MTDPEVFLKTIYLGDGGCKGLLLYSGDRRLRILIDCISRVRDPSGLWNYYSDNEGTSTPVTIRAIAQSCYLEDPRRPGERIT